MKTLRDITVKACEKERKYRAQRRAPRHDPYHPGYFQPDQFADLVGFPGSLEELISESCGAFDREPYRIHYTHDRSQERTPSFLPSSLLSLLPQPLPISDHTRIPDRLAEITADYGLLGVLGL